MELSLPCMPHFRNVGVHFSLIRRYCQIGREIPSHWRQQSQSFFITFPSTCIRIHLWGTKVSSSLAVYLELTHNQFFHLLEKIQAASQPTCCIPGFSALFSSVFKDLVCGDFSGSYSPPHMDGQNTVTRLILSLLCGSSPKTAYIADASLSCSLSLPHPTPVMLRYKNRNKKLSCLGEQEHSQRFTISHM